MRIHQSKAFAKLILSPSLHQKLRHSLIPKRNARNGYFFKIELDQLVLSSPL